MNKRLTAYIQIAKESLPTGAVLLGVSEQTFVTTAAVDGVKVDFKYQGEKLYTFIKVNSKNLEHAVKRAKGKE